MSTPRTNVRHGHSAAGDGFFGRLRRLGAGDGFVGMVRRLASVVVAGSARFVRIRRNRRATLDLLDLDADRLADIGLTRADVHVALFDPRTPDPTGLLETFAADRRRPGRRRG
jgi:uncharacterized protein YjiS (DUF1127 family)